MRTASHGQGSLEHQLRAANKINLFLELPNHPNSNHRTLPRLNYTTHHSKMAEFKTVYTKDAALRKLHSFQTSLPFSHLFSNFHLSPSSASALTNTLLPQPQDPIPKRSPRPQLSTAQDKSLATPPARS